MQNITAYLIANPFIAAGIALLVLLCVYNALRRQTRVALGMWLVLVVVLFYLHVQIDSEEQVGDEAIVAPPPAAPETATP